MTDKADITALREHNQHIVAHLTRSNPRRPLNSAEVLTLESAKLVVAALSVRDGMPDVERSEYWFEHEGKLLFDGALFNSRVAIFIGSQLEAERQRAAGSEEELHKALHREKAVERKLLAAQEEIETLKAKLANPVVLPTRKNAGFYSDEGFNNKDLAAINNCAILEVEKRIHAAGFTTVKGE